MMGPSPHAPSRLEISVPIDAHIVTDGPTTVVPDENLRDDELDSGSTVSENAAHERASRSSLQRILAFGLLPGLALIIAIGAGYLKWQDNSAQLEAAASRQGVQAAVESTIALLSYKPDTVDTDLTAARDRLTGTFRDDYTKLINEVVIPGSKQKHISAVATVPAAGPVSASENQATVLVFVNQTVAVGNDPPTNTASSIRITLDKVHDRWLISQFDPV